MKFQLWLFYVTKIKPLIILTKSTFTLQLNQSAKFLDIGCGNHSPYKTKIIRPDLYYVGADIAEYNLDTKDKELANEIHIFEESVFFEKILELPHQFDAIMCAHVIEHLPNYDILFKIFYEKLTPNGKIYLSTPNIASINFPSTKIKGNTLNYYDDTTHTKMPLHFYTIYSLCQKNNLRIILYKLKNRNLLTYSLGFLMEFLRIFNPKIYAFTYQYWGFEDVYIISK